MSETYTVNLTAIKSLNVRIKNVSDCHQAQQAALRDSTFANRRKEVQQLKDESENRSQALQEEMRLRVNLAAAQRQPGTHLDIGVNLKLLVHHLKNYPLYYGSFQKASDPCFMCGATLRKLRNPHYGVKKDVQGKKKRRKDRLELIKAARAKAAEMPEGERRRTTLKTAEDFALYMDAAEKAMLSRDVYHYTDDKINAEGAPAGYLRGSENPEMLKKLGISREVLKPPDSKFRAEVYLPDLDVFGPDANPILLFKGTDLNCLEDASADVTQAGGKTTGYYEQAIKLGKMLHKNTSGNFESAGHSLGGGMASAVALVTGCVATVYNPAGVHPNTVAPYIRNTTTDSSNISVFVVEGEVLTASQDAANRLGREMMEISAKSKLPSFDPALIGLRMLGPQLGSVPTQIGRRTTLPCQIDLRTPDIVSRHLMDNVITSIEQEKRRYQRGLRQAILDSKETIGERESVG